MGAYLKSNDAAEFKFSVAVEGVFSEKKLRQIAFLAVLNFFTVQKWIFGHFGNCKKWNLVKNFFVKMIYFISPVTTVVVGGGVCLYKSPKNSVKSFLMGFG